MAEDKCTSNDPLMEAYLVIYVASNGKRFKKKVEDHLKECPYCQRRIKEMKEFSEWLASPTVREVIAKHGHQRAIINLCMGDLDKAISFTKFAIEYEPDEAKKTEYKETLKLLESENS